MRVSTLRALPMLLAAGALPLAAQTTGTLQGRVQSSGRPITGAQITLAGATLQGSRTTTSDDQGNFRFGLLPPGTYAITVVKEGLNTSKLSTQVGLDRTATLDIQMTTISAAIVEVTDVATAVDVKATTVGANYSSDTFNKLPLSRDFASIATLAPGISTDNLPNGQQGLKVYGASGVENNYVVDGINTTNVEFGSQGKKIPVEFIQELQVKTGGYEAEYGKATGGIINVVTKSGGNTFSGDAFYYFESKALQAGNKHENENLGGFKPLPIGFRKSDFGFDFGGPIIQDKLWFFVAYDRTDYGQRDRILTGAAGSEASLHRQTDLFAGKLTWRLTENQSLIASFIGDPSKTSGEVDGHPAVGPIETWDGNQKVGGTDLNLRYELSGTTWFSQIQASKHHEVNEILPGVGGFNSPQLIDTTAGGAASGGFGRWDKKDFTRTNISGSFTKFFDLLGSHEAKAGFDFQSDKADISRNYSGGQLVYNLGGGVYSHVYWTTPDASNGSVTPWNAPSITFSSQPKHESQAFFIQDKWSINSHWVLNLGVRTDSTEIKDQFGKAVIKLKDEYAPRLGLIYDWRGQGQDKVYLSMGRFYEQLPLDLVIRSFSVERNPDVRNFDPVSLVPNGGAGTSTIAGSYVEPVDPDLKGQYMDQFILGAETTFGKYVFGVKYIRNYLGRVIEDALDVNSPAGDYFIMNPGFSTTGVQYTRAVRDFKGFEFTAQRKFSDGYTWQVSYLWSKLDGNYEGGYSGIGYTDGAGQLDPNITAAFDEPAFMVNNSGPLSGDRRHQLKANGAYELPFGLSFGASAYFSTGTPVTRLGAADQVTPFPYTGRYELFLTPRGAEGRTPNTHRLDLNLAYTFTLANKIGMRAMLDITNVFDQQMAQTLDQRYNFSGLDVGQSNSHFKQPASYQSPRSIRLGLRVSF
jgi:hypothetical protein